jgi:hypothetical protein
MADKKISALTAASTPLAGTEVLPIVQSGSTVKVSVANLTAGRAVAMAGGSFTDNITQSTAAKGVNFTANTPAAGMTSQLLNWYEEGTYTATLTPTTSGTLTLNASYNTLRYTRIGRQVTISGELRLTAASSPVGSVNINLPFAAGNSLCFGACAIYDANAKTGGLITNANATTAYFSEFSYSAIAASDFSGNEQMIISLTYTV